MQAEAEYWKRSQGYRTGWSDELLGFDCGGQQWVLETCFHAGTQTYASLTVSSSSREAIQETITSCLQVVAQPAWRGARVQAAAMALRLTAAGTCRQPSGADLAAMQELLQLIEDRRIAAPAPIEQRWSAASSSPMSPASSDAPEDLFTWVGIIMYLPTEDAEERKVICSRWVLCSATHCSHALQLQLL